MKKVLCFALAFGLMAGPAWALTPTPTPNNTPTLTPTPSPKRPDSGGQGSSVEFLELDNLSGALGLPTPPDVRTPAKCMVYFYDGLPYSLCPGGTPKAL